MIEQIKDKILEKTSPNIRYIYFSVKKKITGRSLKRKYKGSGVECLICKSHYSIFAPFIPFNIKRLETTHVLCPNCGSHKRHRLLWNYLYEKTDLFKRNIRLLHFAPEEAFYNLFSNTPGITYFPVDIAPHKYSYNCRTEIRKVDITHIPFKDGYFDVIICNHVLEHIDDDMLAMSELHRVMNKESGWGIFQVPIDYNRETTYEDFSITDPEERADAFGQPDHVRIYGCDYKDRLIGAGFKVKADPYIKSFSDDEIFKYGLDETELIYVCLSQSCLLIDD